MISVLIMPYPAVDSADLECGLGGGSGLLLGTRVGVNTGTILGPHVVALAHALSRIVCFPELA